MSSVTEINIGEQSNMHYYDPKENEFVSLVPKQLYPMHAKKVDTRTVDVKGKYKAKVHNIIYEIAEECGQKTFLTDRGEVNGASFVGKEVYSTGIFMFLNPQAGDTFEANNGGNERYLRFCEVIKVACPEIEVDVDGSKKMVKSLPHLETSDFVGVPVYATLGLGKAWKGSDGIERKSFEVKSIDKWEKGVKIDVELEELPF